FLELVFKPDVEGLGREQLSLHGAKELFGVAVLSLGRRKCRCEKEKSEDDKMSHWWLLSVARLCMLASRRLRLDLQVFRLSRFQSDLPLVQLCEPVGGVYGEGPSSGGELGDTEAALRGRANRRRNMVAIRLQVNVGSVQNAAHGIVDRAGEDGLARKLDAEFLLPLSPAKSAASVARRLHENRGGAETQAWEIGPAILRGL